MATYNGAGYLAPQLDSILAQTYTRWTLLVHDDGSADSTPAILRRYARRDPRIRILDYPPQGGAKANFASLLSHCRAAYCCFADQDDVWLPHKLSTLLDAVRGREAELGAEVPVVAYSDLEVVDASLRTIAPSMWAYSGIRPERLTTFRRACVTNFATGCAMMFNGAAREAVRPMTRHAYMHDAWLTLCALGAGGAVVAVAEPLVRYRQHGSNALGALDASRYTPLYKLRHAAAMARDVWRQWLMARDAGSISLPAFIANKWRYSRMRRAR